MSGGILADSLAGLPARVSPKLQATLDRVVEATLAKPWNPALTTNQLAVTAVELDDSAEPAYASFRGQAPIYPASVIKLFYLAAVHRWMEDGRLKDTPELRRAMRDMIVESYNEPTHYIIDLLTGTTSGPELSQEEIRVWWDKRNSVNRWLATLNYPPTVNASKKPWCEGPYGREMQAIEAFEPKRNFLTTDATARLVTEIALGKCINAARSRQMLELMARDFNSPATDREDQAHGYTGIGLKPEMKLWSKCGSTSETRHDAALIELPDGRKIVVVTFTTGHAAERNIIPTIASELIANLLK